eukprot:g20313.t1
MGAFLQSCRGARVSITLDSKETKAGLLLMVERAQRAVEGCQDKTEEYFTYVQIFESGSIRKIPFQKVVEDRCEEWKCMYRLDLPREDMDLVLVNTIDSDAAVTLHTFGHVRNSTEDDWVDVELHLVANELSILAVGSEPVRQELAKIVKEANSGACMQIFIKTLTGKTTTGWARFCLSIDPEADFSLEVTEEANYEENIPLTEASLEPRQSERGVRASQIAIVAFFLKPYWDWRCSCSKPLESQISRTSFQCSPGELVPAPWKAPEVVLSVVVPAYNEENLKVSGLPSIAAAQHPSHMRLLLLMMAAVTALMLQHFLRAGTHPCSMAKFGSSSGKGFAVRAGMLAARGQLLLMADADGATSIRDLERLERALGPKESPNCK